MKLKRIIAVCISILLVVSLFGCSRVIKPDTGKISVYTSFYVMYDFASKIGGEKAEVINMVPSGTEPHDWEPDAADITGLERAQLFIFNGKGMEHWVEDVLKTIGNKELIVVEAAKGIPDLPEKHSDSEESGDGHSDPHVWLNPVFAKQELLNIKNGFIQADPKNAEYYEANYNRYVAELDALDKEFKDAIQPLNRRDIVVSHEAFGYLCEGYGLNQIAVDGLTPDSEPDAARVAEIIRYIKDNDVKVIFFENQSSAKVAETIAANSGAKVGVLNPIEGLSTEKTANGEDYFSIMRENLAAIVSALE